MKYFFVLFVLLLSCLSLRAASTNTVYLQSGFPLLVGQHAVNTLSNANETPATNVFGYQFNTNDTGSVSWQFPSSIITGTNCVFTLYQLSTNTNIMRFSVTIGSISHTNGTNRYNYLTNIAALGTLVQTNTNMLVLSVTNVWPTNFLSINTNTAYGVIKITHTPTNVVGGNSWFTGGRLIFRN